MTDWAPIASGLLIAGSNIGVVVYIAKKYIEKVDKQSEMMGATNVVIATLTKNSEIVSAAINKMSSNITDLYECRNDHDKQLTKINTIHAIKGCDHLPK